MKLQTHACYFKQLHFLGLNEIKTKKMKNTLLIVFALIAFESNCQINFGLKTGVTFIDNRNENEEVFYLDPSAFISGMLEYKNENLTYEFELLYYQASGESQTNDVKTKYNVTSFLPSLSFKYYPVDKFNIKTGLYINPSRVVRSSVTQNIETQNKTYLKDIGIILGMEAFLYKGLFLDGRFLIDLNNSDDIKTTHMILGIGYKF
ncbi:MAG TPA: hypothetical protein PLL09_10740 [Flavobacterium sp.]|uniref:outer membrane beta-barrel protein n=1 Tax=unclassified Flavobacterium TaxID=196869 RepID=UPI0025C57118|nr:MULTISPECIES: outer membrane beta-barrel protein [unclassified Flavobacterium]HRE78287.1 hypothetical protein [Flavobacterium sp.]